MPEQRHPASTPPCDSPSSARPISVFISYSHNDESLREELDVHLSTLKRQGKIQAWHDRAIEAGAEWDAQIKQQLETAQVILLLISPRFMASDYCYSQEMQRAIERHDAGAARVIPIILKPCDRQDTPFSKLQALPTDAQPITTWDNQDEAFLNVVQGIRKAIETLQTEAPQPSGESASRVEALQPVSPPSPPQFSTYTPQTFTGRAAEITHLTTLLSGNCRVLAILGITGIGKTALAERVIATLMDTPGTRLLPYYRLSLDDRSLTPDFASSGAALLRTLGEEPTLTDQKDPTNLLAHLLNRLCHHPCRLQIDSLERLLRGDDQDGWSEFCDPLWLELLQRFIAGTDCPSQLLLTSQDIPANLDTAASRYPQFWRCQTLHGLSADEQRELFQKLGVETTETDQTYLERIGAFYDGHPLVLRVMADEMLQPPFQGNIARYWHHYEATFAATAPPKAHKLARSRHFRRRVRQRVEQSLQRLPKPARQLLCASAVFRRPVPIDFWQAMLTDGDAQSAFETLQERHLVEYAPATDDLAPLLVRQHNLVRSVAYDRLKAEREPWHRAERRAAQLWLRDYEPAADAPNLETVRGYLEAFEHYCEIEDWETAKDLLLTPLTAFSQVSIPRQLEFWSFYQEGIQVCKKILKKTTLDTDIICFKMLGNYHLHLGSYPKAINYYQQSLTIAHSINDRNGQGEALGNLGIAYYRLGQYEQAIDHHQQQLTIVREIGVRLGEGNALGSLGNAYYSLGQYEQAIDHHQQQLTIAREIGVREAFPQESRKGESIALGNLGVAYSSLGQYEQAIDHYQQTLSIARAIGNRNGEGIALVNLGKTFLKTGQYPESLTYNQAALEIFQEIGGRDGKAEALKNLAALHQALGERETARQYCQQALALATELGIPLAAECEDLWEQLEGGG